MAGADDNPPDAQGRRILAWANFSALVEGALRWFATERAEDYFASPTAPKAPRSADSDVLDEVAFQRLRVKRVKRGWMPIDRYEEWIQLVQHRRNAIYAFRSRPLGTLSAFRAHVSLHAGLATELERRGPGLSGQFGESGC